MSNFFKTIVIAFLFSIVIHFLMYFTIDKTLQNNTLNINTTNKKTITKKSGLVKIKYVKTKKTEQKKTKVKKNIVKNTKQIKEKKQKKTNKRKEITQLSKIKKTIKKIELPKIEKNQIDLKNFFIAQKQEEIQKDNEQQKAKEKQKEIEEIQQLSSLTQSYIKLYGEKYFEFSKYQKRYLKQNLNKIGQITQRYLQYPRVSIRTRQKGINVVEFFLHPNGDISDLKLSDSTQYTALDTNTIETIRIAYQDYPTPREKIQIKIYVKYILN